MNKQEAIKSIDTLNINDIIAGQNVDMVIKNQVIDLISQIHEPQKVVVPKFVAEWIEHCKGRRSTLYFAFTPSRMSRELNEWMALGKNDDIFTRAWLDGYEIEQEKLYTVEIPNNGGFIVLAYINQTIKLADSNKHLPGKFTKESIEYAGFGWVFDCNGVKVVEVE
ncbi:DUF1642 domain-containing protein [Streptococcus suis]|uniref:DUF1642 domain-containing protein n=1 Tax=Streptococcus suis TaxID=1307 RepID=A0A7T1LAV0_STRSU|nr:DUF1642 domain-containing protein [Streptococcus suis]MDW8720737.1 DUF1642 domain-containing protein [Streptococcus suis]MDY7596205.1 DUF1642 domain-containing protein [Streptococcus suis]QPO26995.1 DUF1642 domain-containing protein [Streptococcus suis]WNF69856.1 DUF1642 domain-containing protein [Streptococcus suis]HEL1580467.1 DUF1642 domain-containing protein [Streptococcus suis]